jgi:hypothetical protein
MLLQSLEHVEGRRDERYSHRVGTILLAEDAHFHTDVSHLEPLAH